MINRILERLERKKELAQDLWDGGSRAKGYEIAIEIVKEVAKDGGWIPVEQRMPENKSYGEVYWVTLRDKLGIVCVRKMRWYGKGKWVWMNGQDLGSEWEVTAWKVYEVPAPYQRGE